MTRAGLEAAIWAVTGRAMTGEQVDALVDVAEAYAAERAPHQCRAVLHHTGPRDLFPVIGVLADALLGETEWEAADAA